MLLLPNYDRGYDQMDNIKVVIFGTKTLGKKALDCLKDKYEIIAFSDNNANIWGE